MRITDILVGSNRRCTDAYCQGQRSECVGGWSRLFSLLGYLSSGSIQMPKSFIVRSHSNNTIVPSICVCLVCVFALICLSLLCFVQESLVLLYARLSLCLCVCIVCACASQQHAFAFPEAGGFLCLQQQCSLSLKCSRANAAQMWPRFSGTAAREVAHGQKLLLREKKQEKNN